MFSLWIRLPRRAWRLVTTGDSIPMLELAEDQQHDKYLHVTSCILPSQCKPV